MYVYIYLGVQTSKECSWDAHVSKKVIGKGQAHVVSKVDAIDPNRSTP